MSKDESLSPLKKKEFEYMKVLDSQLEAGTISPKTHKALSFEYLKKLQRERREMIEEITNHLKSLQK